jgi:hypothetical protein
MKDYEKWRELFWCDKDEEELSPLCFTVEALSEMADYDDRQ